jgi:hypothetical protein
MQYPTNRHVDADRMHAKPGMRLYHHYAVATRSYHRRGEDITRIRRQRSITYWVWTGYRFVQPTRHWEAEMRRDRRRYSTGRRVSPETGTWYSPTDES